MKLVIPSHFIRLVTWPLYYIVIMITLKFIYYDYVSVPSNRTTIEIRNSLFVLDSSVFWNEMMVL